MNTMLFNFLCLLWSNRWTQYGLAVLPIRTYSFGYFNRLHTTKLWLFLLAFIGHPQVEASFIQ